MSKNLPLVDVDVKNSDVRHQSEARKFADYFAVARRFRLGLDPVLHGNSHCKMSDENIEQLRNRVDTVFRRCGRIIVTHGEIEKRLSIGKNAVHDGKSARKFDARAEHFAVSFVRGRQYYHRLVECFGQKRVQTAHQIDCKRKIRRRQILPMLVIDSHHRLERRNLLRLIGIQNPFEFKEIRESVVEHALRESNRLPVTQFIRAVCLTDCDQLQYLSTLQYHPICLHWP